jgi:hypothetical protein
VLGCWWDGELLDHRTSASPSTGDPEETDFFRKLSLSTDLQVGLISKGDAGWGLLKEPESSRASPVESRPLVYVRGGGNWGKRQF